MKTLSVRVVPSVEHDTSGLPTKVTEATFTSEVLEVDRPVLVDFWAGWCGPCRLLEPVIEDIARDRDDLKVAKLNVGESPRIAGRFGVRSIPQLILFVDGEERMRIVGARSKGHILRKIDQLLSPEPEGAGSRRGRLAAWWGRINR